GLRCGGLKTCFKVRKKGSKGLFDFVRTLVGVGFARFLSSVDFARMLPAPISKIDMIRATPSRPSPLLVFILPTRRLPPPRRAAHHVAQSSFNNSNVSRTATRQIFIISSSLRRYTPPQFPSFKYPRNVFGSSWRR